MAFDFKKEYKEFFLPPEKPIIVTVPKANYIAVHGKGNPNDEGGAYQQAIGLSEGFLLRRRPCSAIVWHSMSYTNILLLFPYRVVV